MTEFSHFDDRGQTRIVDVSGKAVTVRIARARGVITMQPETLTKIVDRQFHKGDVLEVARLAGIMAAKKTAELIPLCHTIPIEAVKLQLEPVGGQQVVIEAEVTTSAKTGVEMEALTAVTVAALTVYDMCKSVDRAMQIGSVELLEKQGGKSGHYIRSSAETSS